MMDNRVQELLGLLQRHEDNETALKTAHAGVAAARGDVAVAREGGDAPTLKEAESSLAAAEDRLKTGEDVRKDIEEQLARHPQFEAAREVTGAQIPRREQVERQAQTIAVKAEVAEAVSFASTVPPLSVAPVFPKAPTDPQQVERHGQMILAILGDDPLKLIASDGHVLSDKEIAKIRDDTVASTLQPDMKSVYVRETGPGETYYAFTTRVGEGAGYRNHDSIFYTNGDQIRVMEKHGLINHDAEHPTINKAAIRDLLALPPTNQIDCVVSLAGPPLGPVAAVESTAGPAIWRVHGDDMSPTLELRGGGAQVHPDMEEAHRQRWLNGISPESRQLPIATIDGRVMDLSRYEVVDRPLSETQREALMADYQQLRAPEASMRHELMRERMVDLETTKAELPDQIRAEAARSGDYQHPAVCDLRTQATHVDHYLNETRLEWAARCIEEPELYKPWDAGMEKQVDRQRAAEEAKRQGLALTLAGRSASTDEHQNQRQAALENQLQASRRESLEAQRSAGLSR